MLLVFNFLSGLISCYFLAHAVNLTKLESFQELVYFFGGGRAGILFITLLQIMVYSEMPITFMYNLDVMINKEIKELNVRIEDYWTHIFLTLICLAFLPSVVIRHLNRIKVLILVVDKIFIDSWTSHHDNKCLNNLTSYDLFHHRYNPRF